MRYIFGIVFYLRQTTSGQLIVKTHPYAKKAYSAAEINKKYPDYINCLPRQLVTVSVVITRTRTIETTTLTQFCLIERNVLK